MITTWSVRRHRVRRPQPRFAKKYLPPPGCESGVEEALNTRAHRTASRPLRRGRTRGKRADSSK